MIVRRKKTLQSVLERLGKPRITAPPASLSGGEGGVATEKAEREAEDAALAAAIAAKQDAATAATDAELDAEKSAREAADALLATKSEVSGLLAAADAFVYKGVLDCSANPNYPAADAGHAYKVSVAGKIGGASGPNVEVGDLLLCVTDGSASGNHATVGSKWDIVQVNIDGAVTGPAASVNGNLPSFNGVSGKVIQDSGAAAANVPTTDQKSALAGSQGAPSNTNRYVTDADPRLSLGQISLRDAMLSLDPDLYWPLDKTYGVTDQSGNGNNGTAKEGAKIGEGTSIVANGDPSTDLDGANDYISSTLSLDPSAGARTIVGILQRDTGGTKDTILDSDGRIYLSSETQFAIAGVTGPADATIIGAQFPGTAIPVPFAIVVDDSLAGGAGRIRIYLHGVLVSEHNVAGPTGLGWSAGNFALGGATDPFDGKFSHVGVFPRELSTASILWLATLALGREPFRDWGLVTSLPSSTLCIRGDRCSYIADSTNGVIWELIYDGLGEYPWKKIGGPALFAEVMTDQGTASTSYTTLATAGPAITTPLKGDYGVTVEASMYAEAAGAARAVWMSYQVGEAAASDNDAAEGGIESQVVGRTHRSERLKTGIAAGTSIAARYRTNSGTGKFRRRRMWINPVRVG